jgi:hypothetical protein
MKFVLVIEEKSCHQAQKIQDIRTGRSREVECNKVWVPEIAMSYYAIKSGYKSKEDEDDSSGDDHLPIGKFAKTIKKKNEVKSKKKDGRRGRKARSDKMEEDSEDDNLPIISCSVDKEKEYTEGQWRWGEEGCGKAGPIGKCKGELPWSCYQST